MDPLPLAYRAVAGPDDLYPQFRAQDGAAATAIAALSQHSAPPPGGAGVAPGSESAGAATMATATPTATRKRRSTGVPSNRGVANLTPEQLAKKRANDREAQRAIRERTRKTIEDLQDRINELESQQPFQELQRALQERDRALAECEELRRKLQQVAGIAGGASTSVSPAQSQPNLHELANVTAQQSPLPPLTIHPSMPQQISLATTGPIYEQSNLHPDLRSPLTQAATTAGSVKASRTHTNPGSVSPVSKRARKWSATNSDRPTSVIQPVANGVVYDQPHHQTAMLQVGSGGHGGTSHLLDRAADGSAMPAPQMQSLNAANFPPLWKRLPWNGESTCPLDTILESFIEKSHNQITSGVPIEKVIGPYHPTMGPLRVPPDNSDVHPLSALLIDMLYKFPDFKKLPEQVAVVYVVSRNVRWHICPCESCYNDLPPWMRPIREQHEISHARWMDYIPWPSIRRRLLQPSSTVKFEDFFVSYTKTLSLNWPLSDSEILLTPMPGVTNPVEITPAFEAHMRDLGNWSLGDEFASACPSLMSSDVRMN